MKKYKIPYGHQELTLALPDSCEVDWIEPAYVPQAQDPLALVRDCLLNPVDGIALASYASVKSVAIAINDKTRPVPHDHLLPPLLDALARMGIPDAAIRFFIATGTHLPLPADEFQRVLPEEILKRYCVVSHDIKDEANLAALGRTSRGTPVQVNRQYYESDLKIVVGNIEPHHFAGFSGGYKTAAIGLGGRETINHNHSMLSDPQAGIARFDHNPLRQDIEEIGDLISVQFALNAILNGDKKIVKAVCGSPRSVMAAGIPLSQEICQTTTTGKYDLVIASAGGAPKDINFYQSQKALTHAALFTRQGGIMILAAECPEGSGNQAYENFMEGLTSFQQVFDKFKREEFRVGPHKAIQVARIAEQGKIVLVSAIEPDLVKRLLMTPASSADEAIQLSINLLEQSSAHPLRIAILPRATNTVPVHF